MENFKMTHEVNDAIEKIAKTFEEFKSANDQKFSEIEKKGSADVLLTEKVEKINDTLSGLTDIKTRLESVENRQARQETVTDEQVSVEGNYKSAFLDYMRNPADRDVANKVYDAYKAVKATSLNTTTNAGADSGYAIPAEIAAAIMARLEDASPIRQHATVETVGTTDYAKLIDLKGASAAWVAEAGTIAASTTPTLREIKPTFGKLVAYPSATEESLEDPFFNTEQWLIDSVSSAFAVAEGTAFITGNGTNKPTGLLTGTPVVTADATRAAGVLQFVAGGHATLLNNSDKLLDVVYAAQGTYRQAGQWFMNSGTINVIRQLKDGNGNYMWQPSLVAGQPDAIAGYTVVTDEEMPAIAANAFPVAFGDMARGYLITDRVGMAITRDDITSPGSTKWYVRKRIGGIRMEDRAIKLLKIAL